ncbi:MAG: FAD-dependent oxidoreductase [Balneolaceae bacterium]|nr:FAD-dependent oxidoreductase [Balneolaceae bacterium]
MKIGIVGAGLSGLVAGRKLALAGHDVTVIEKNRELGGKLATTELGGMTADYGYSHFEVSRSSFARFVDELREEGLARTWAQDFALHDGTQYHGVNPNVHASNWFAAPRGMNAIARYLARWVDVKSAEKVGGMTFIGSHRSRKRAWMLNLTDISVFECDAVILAAPAPEAYGVLQTAQDETPARRIIRHIDDIRYKPAYALLVHAEAPPPTWRGITCDGEMLRWIGNEGSKRTSAEDGESNAGALLMLHSSARFARTHVHADPEEVTRRMLDRASEITGLSLHEPRETRLHFWKYFQPLNPLKEYFMELEMEEAPLALVGDYFMGSSLEDAFLSGEKLAEYWISRYSEHKQAAPLS